MRSVWGAAFGIGEWAESWENPGSGPHSSSGPSADIWQMSKCFVFSCRRNLLADWQREMLAHMLQLATIQQCNLQLESRRATLPNVMLMSYCLGAAREQQTAASWGPKLICSPAPRFFGCVVCVMKKQFWEFASMLAKQTRGDITCHNICDPDMLSHSPLTPRPFAFCIFCMFFSHLPDCGCIESFPITAHAHRHWRKSRKFINN